MELRDRFFDAYRATEREFSQVPFWFWNDTLEEAELARQMADFQAHGVHAFVIHPRVGLPRECGWMSRRLLECMRFTLEEARRRDMWVFLYDEGMYPSGSSSGQVVAENPEYACRGLVCIDLTTARPGDIVQGVRIGADGMPMPDASQNVLAIVPRQRDGHRMAIIDRSLGSVIRGLHLLEDDPPRRADRREVPECAPPAGDLLNPDAMRCFIRLVYQRFHDEFAPYFGNVIRGIFTDEPSLLGRCGWEQGGDPRPGTRDILEHVSGWLGYDFVPHLPALWDHEEPEAERFRRDYALAVHARLETTYYGPLSDWCDRHGVALCGHPSESDEIGALRHFHIPGQDIVWRMIEPGKPGALEGAHATQAKCASSSMIHLGRSRNLNEFAGAYGHDLTWEEFRWLALWLLVRGCNMLLPHAFYYSLRGPRIDERPRDVGPNSPWWDHYAEFSTLTGLLSWLNTGCVHVCDLAILGRANHLPWRAAAVCQKRQVDFNYLEERHLWEDAVVDAEGISLRGMRYRALLLEEEPASRAAPALRVLDDAGRLVRWCPEAGENDVPTALRALCGSDVALECPHDGIRFRHVVKDGRDVYLLFNEASVPYAGRISLSAFLSDRAEAVALPDGLRGSWSDGVAGIPGHGFLLLVGEEGDK